MKRTHTDLQDVYWDQRYTLRSIPPFLEPLKVRILHAGKYLNLLLECGIKVQSPKILGNISTGDYYLPEDIKLALNGAE